MQDFYLQQSISQYSKSTFNFLHHGPAPRLVMNLCLPLTLTKLPAAILKPIKEKTFIVVPVCSRYYGNVVTEHNSK